MTTLLRMWLAAKMEEERRRGGREAGHKMRESWAVPFHAPSPGSHRLRLEGARKGDPALTRCLNW